MLNNVSADGEGKDEEYTVLAATLTYADGTEVTYSGDKDSPFGPAQQLVLGANGVVPIGKEPLTLAMTDYGGEGQKFTLRVYSQAPVSLRQLPDDLELVDGESVPNDHPLRNAFAKYDNSGDGTIDKSELLQLLLELDLMPAVDEAVATEFLADQVAKADTNQDGKIDFAEFTQYYNACIVAAGEAVGAD